MMPAMIRREAHRPQARSGGNTALTCRNVNVLTRAAERDRNEPRVGTDSVMEQSQHKMVTFVNGNVIAACRTAVVGELVSRPVNYYRGMPRPPNPDVRKRLLSAGLDLVHAQGFAASGVKDITDAAGVPKGSFYAYFSSKEALAAAILEHYWAGIEARLLPILETDRPVLERVVGFFHGLADEHEAGDFLLGCLIGNLALELSSSSEVTRAELVWILDRWGAALAACVRSGQRGSGEVRGDVDAGELAAQLIEAWEGAALRGKVTRSRMPYDRFEAVTIPALLH